MSEFLRITNHVCIFFFSSRRRHTRLSGDWSQTCALPIYVPDTHRFWLKDRGDRRHHPGGHSASATFRPARCGRFAARHAGREFHVFYRGGRGAPPVGAAHRQFLRAARSAERRRGFVTVQVRVTVQRVTRLRGLPRDKKFALWVDAVLRGAGYRRAAELAIRLVNEAEGCRLNREWRSEERRVGKECR